MFRRGYDGRSLKLDMINLNSTSNWFHSDELEEMDGAQTVIPRNNFFYKYSICSGRQLPSQIKPITVVCNARLVEERIILKIVKISLFPRQWLYLLAKILLNYQHFLKWLLIFKNSHKFTKMVINFQKWLTFTKIGDFFWKLVTTFENWWPLLKFG